MTRFKTCGSASTVCVTCTAVGVAVAAVAAAWWCMHTVPQTHCRIEMPRRLLKDAHGANWLEKHVLCVHNPHLLPALLLAWALDLLRCCLPVGWSVHDGRASGSRLPHDAHLQWHHGEWDTTFEHHVGSLRVGLDVKLNHRPLITHDNTQQSSLDAFGKLQLLNSCGNGWKASVMRTINPRRLTGS